MSAASNETRLWPIVRAAGTARTRGKDYGAQASRLVQRSLESYEAIFAHYAGLTWRDARAAALRFVDPIEDFDGTSLQEMEGIAAGAGVDFEDVLALNVRTELMFGYGSAGRECTALAALPEVTGGRTIVAQNWDWKPFVADSLVIVAMRPSDGPGFVSMMEAGLLAKTGVNAHGVAVVTNALVSDRDRGAAGIPYHVLLRGILTTSSVTQAADLISSADRASSGNYLVAKHGEGAVNIECEPGSSAHAYPIEPHDGVLVHANHFISPALDGADLELAEACDTVFRHERAAQHLRAVARSGQLDVRAIQETLADHENFPGSICCHAPDGEPAVGTYESITSIIMDLTSQQMLVTAGQPCTTPYVAVDEAELLVEAAAATPP